MKIYIREFPVTTKKKIREKALQQTFFQYKNFFPFDSLITRIYPSMRDVTVEFQNE